MGDRHQLGPWSQHFFVFVDQQLTGVTDGNDAQVGTLFLAQNLPRDDVRVMLHGGDDNVISLSQVRACITLGYQIDSVGGALHEYNLLVGGRVKELPRLAPTHVEVLGGALTKGVHAPVDVGVVRGIVINQ